MAVPPSRRIEIMQTRFNGLSDMSLHACCILLPRWPCVWPGEFVDVLCLNGVQKAVGKPKRMIGVFDLEARFVFCADARLAAQRDASFCSASHVHL